MQWTDFSVLDNTFNFKSMIIFFRGSVHYWDCVEYVIPSSFVWWKNDVHVQRNKTLHVTETVMRTPHMATLRLNCRTEIITSQ